MSEEIEQQQEGQQDPVENPVAVDSEGNPVALEPAEEVTTGTAVEPAEAAESEETPDLVTLTREKYEIDASVSDALVVEFAGVGSASLNEWSTELLLAVLKGQIRHPEDDLKNLIIVYRQRVEVPSAWNDQGVIEFLRSGVEPKKTSTGVWLVDVTRSTRLATDWSTAELEAWAKGEIQAGGKSHDNGIALELKARLSLNCEDSPKSVRKAYRALASSGVKLASNEASSPVNVEASPDETEQLQRAKAVAAKIEKVEGLTTMNVAFIDDGLAKYIEAVQPNKPIGEAAALKAQNDLDATLQYVTRLEGKALVAGMERLKATFKKQMVDNGVFSASNVFRFTHLMRSDNKRQQRHVGLLEAMRVYFSDMKEARKQVDVRALLQYQPEERVNQLVEYFTRVA